LYFCCMESSFKHISVLISSNVHEVDADAQVFLFGSKARGNDHEDSDWDILILTNYPVDIKTEQKFRHNLIKLELETGESVSTFVYYKKDWESKHKVTPFFKNVNQDSILI
jgi:uncharacterized protein